MVHSLITLYSADETMFETNGLGSLGEATSCKVTEEANGAFELEMTYPIHGRRFSDIKLRNIIFTKPNPVDPPQGFRIYEISKPINGIVTIYASHLRYDLNGYPVAPFEASGCNEAFLKLKSNSVFEHPFTFWTDIDSSAELTLDRPVMTTNMLGGMEGSILDVYGGEYKFDNFSVRLYKDRGSDRGVVIRYGKNMTDLKQEESCSNVYTHVLPYWESEDSLVTLSDYVIPTGVEYDYTNVLILDLSSEFEDPPLESDLIEVASEYISNNDLGTPKVSLTVSFIQLEQTEEYKDLALLERVELFDTVKVEFPELGVSATSKVKQTVYNPLTERYDSINLGDIRTNISDTIISQEESRDQLINESKSYFNQSVERATQWIVNGKGYMVAVRDDDGHWKEICSLDNPDISQALHVWRWNNGGFGHSSTGYNGPFTTAITQEGEIVADFITAGVLHADLIKDGVLASSDGEAFYLDIKNSILKMNATQLSISGRSVQEVSNQSAKDAVDTFISDTYREDMEALKEQSDKKAETWYQIKDPADNWKETEKSEHVGDLWYNSSPDVQKYYRWDGTQWQEMTSTPPDSVFNQINGKAQVFIDTPTIPYYQGDLWFDSETEEIMTCISSRITGEYTSTDWRKRNKYTDDTIANQALEEAMKSAPKLKLVLDKDYEAVPESYSGGTLSIPIHVYPYYGETVLKACTVSAFINGVEGRWTDNTNHIFTVTKMTKDSGYVSFSAEYKSQRSNAQFDILKRPNSSDERTYVLQFSHTVIVRSTENVLTPTDLTISCYYRSGSSSSLNQYSGGYLVVEASYDGVSFYIRATMNMTSYTTTFPTPNLSSSNVAIRVSLYTSEADSESGTPLARQTIQIIEQTGAKMSQEEILSTLSPLGEIYIGEDGRLYISWTAAKGGYLRLGGESNVNGELIVYNSLGYEIGRWNESGISMSSGKISSQNGKVYFDMNNNELRCTKLIGATGGSRPSAADIGYPDSSSNYTSSFRVYQDGKPETNIYMRVTPGDRNARIGAANVQTLDIGNAGAELSFYANVFRLYSNQDSGVGHCEVEANTVNSKVKLGENVNVSHDLTVQGNLRVLGTKPRLVSTPNYGNRLQYCYEMASPIFGDIGEGVMDETGECCIFLDDNFLETVSTQIEYQVFLQKEGPGDLWVDTKELDHFVVKGTPNLKFAWEVKVIQRDYEFERLDEDEALPDEREADRIIRGIERMDDKETEQLWEDLIEDAESEDYLMDNYIHEMEEISNDSN